MSLATATLPALTISSRRRQAQGKAEVLCGGKIQYIESRLAVPNLQSLPFQRRVPILHATGMRSRSVICAGAAEGQTQTVTRESSTITVAPVQGKEKSPDLDDGGSGLPPRDDGDGGGGGGGGGGWSGGFFFFGFLALLGLLKDQEEEAPYKDKRRRYAN